MKFSKSQNLLPFVCRIQSVKKFKFPLKLNAPFQSASLKEFPILSNSKKYPQEKKRERKRERIIGNPHPERNKVGDIRNHSHILYAESQAISNIPIENGGEIGEAAIDNLGDEWKHGWVTSLTIRISVHVLAPYAWP